MKRLIILLLLVMVATAGCGGSSEKKEIESTMNMMTSEIKLYMLSKELEERTGEKRSFESSINRIRAMAEFEENEDIKKQSLRLADLLEADDEEGLSQLYEELGGKKTN